MADVTKGSNEIQQEQQASGTERGGQSNKQQAGSGGDYEMEEVQPVGNDRKSKDKQGSSNAQGGEKPPDKHDADSSQGDKNEQGPSGVGSEEYDLQGQQETRAMLRESFLKGVAQLHGKTCTIHTYESTELQAVFTAWHPNSNDIIVRDLVTPACHTISTALLRGLDVLDFTFDTPI